jgi:hypothetical protein
MKRGGWTGSREMGSSSSVVIRQRDVVVYRKRMSSLMRAASFRS